MLLSGQWVLGTARGLIENKSISRCFKMLKKSISLIAVLGLSACSGAGSQVYLDSGSITLSQAAPGKVIAPATLVGFLPSVPVGSEFSSGGTLSVKGKVPVVEKTPKAPLHGYFGTSKSYSNSGSLTLKGKIN